jgi:heavy metal translocating P-type ATPase
MIPLSTIALRGGIAGAGLLFRGKQDRRKASLVDTLANQQSTAIHPQKRSSLQQALQKVKAQLDEVDERYQQFVQEHIDPLLGKTRHGQLQEMLGEEPLVLSREERLANRRFALGMTSLTFSLVGYWLFPPLIPLAIGVGLLGSSAAYLYAYEEWKRTKRLGAIHLLCVYSLFLWLGGNAAAGGMGAALFGLMLKTKTLSETRSRNNLVSMFQLQPDKVWVRSNGAEIEIGFDQLQIGDTIVLYAGQIVPVDGTIVAGAATVDQHMLTGEAQPVEKRVGDAVLAVTLLISGQIDIKVEKTSKETTAGQIAEILNRTAGNSRPNARAGIATIDWLVLPTLALSAASWPFIGTAGAVSLIGANSTFTSHLSGSLAMLNYLNLAANSGILVKNARALEQLNAIDTIVFDKTGTLTLEQPQIAQIHTLTQVDADAVLRFAAAAEARQTHPIARAILDAAAERKLHLPTIDQAHYEVGYGIKVRLVEDDQVTSTQRVPEGDMVIPGDSLSSSPSHLVTPSPSHALIRVGSGRFMTMEGIALPVQVQTLTDACQAQGHSLVMVAVNDELVGAIELRPTVRPEAQQIVQGLRKLGLDLYIISGDQETPTRTLAHTLGMTGYFANTLPEAKADLVAGLQADGRTVCFIGDGINDAIAMRQAEVSISLRGATTVATDTAQVILMKGDLTQLRYLFQLGRDFARDIKLNVRFTTGVSAVAVSGILLAGFTFIATEVFYAISLFGGLTIAMKPLLVHRKQKGDI